MCSRMLSSFWDVAHEMAQHHVLLKTYALVFGGFHRFCEHQQLVACAMQIWECRVVQTAVGGSRGRLSQEPM